MLTLKEKNLLYQWYDDVHAKCDVVCKESEKASVFVRQVLEDSFEKLVEEILHVRIRDVDAESESLMFCRGRFVDAVVDVRDLLYDLEELEKDMTHILCRKEDRK